MPNQMPFQINRADPEYSTTKNTRLILPVPQESVQANASPCPIFQATHKHILILNNASMTRCLFVGSFKTG